MVTKNAEPGDSYPNFITSCALDLRGLSSNTKPTENVPNGSTYIEMDTGNGFFWDAENSQWREP